MVFSRVLSILCQWSTPNFGSSPTDPTWQGKLKDFCWSSATSTRSFLKKPQTESPKQQANILPVLGFKVKMHTVVLPTYLFSLTASTNSFCGSSTQSLKDLLTFWPIISHNFFEQSPGSTPWSAQPPTPSATTSTFSDANMASSPPLYAFSGCGIMCAPCRNLYLNFFSTEKPNARLRPMSLLAADPIILIQQPMFELFIRMTQNIFNIYNPQLSYHPQTTLNIRQLSIIHQTVGFQQQEYRQILSVDYKTIKMKMKQYYKGKRLLVTGTTGFLGKVLLQKILYSLPEVELVYVLIRGKKGSHLLQRFKKEIVSSPCFDRIRAQHGNQFEHFIQQKVKPIQGDLHKDGLGLSEKDYTELVEKCHIILNCAASIDFNARLDQAIESNIKGSLRMMQLAKDMKNLEIFTHVSTCYVNCNMTGLIREEIYDGQEDPEVLFARLNSMSTRDLVANTEEILGTYPNTYTFTKALCQRLMKLRRGDLTLTIIRPAIINTSYREPFPGWLDSIAAAAAYFMFVGLGIIKEVEANPNIIGDTIPVDIVVADILVASAYNSKSHKLSLYHSGSSDRNPLIWKDVQQVLQDYWNSNISPNRISKSKILYTNNKFLIKTSQLSRKIPISIYSRLAPFLGSQHVKNAQKLIKAEERAEQIKGIFKFFVKGEWIYQSRGIKDLTNWLTESDRQEFLVDVADIDMRYFIILNNYGIQKYILKQNTELPVPENSNLLRMHNQKSYFSDIKWALSGGSPNISDKQLDKEIKSKILVSSRVLLTIEKETLQRLENSSRNFEEEKKLVMKEAQQIVGQLIGEFRMPVIRFMAWTLHKIFKRIYEKVNVNSEMFSYLSSIENERKIPIVLLPTHRSYIDFLIVSYIFFLYKLKLPYIISDQALMNAYLIPFLIKSSGAFFFRPAKFSKSQLYQAIFNQYIQRLLINGNNMEFFIEGSRSRTGKIQPARSEILEILLETVEEGMVNDICLVPLTINYEKVLEGDTFPAELLGEEKVQESLLRVVKALPLLKVNFGRVYVQISQPIFLNSYVKSKKNNQLKLNKSIIARQLGLQIIYRLNQKTVIMSTGVVSAVLLMYKNGISEDQLIKTVNWLAKYIVRKGYKIGGINENSSAFAVRNAIHHLENITVRSKKSIFQLQIIAGNEFQKILMLSYYRNTISHAFIPQAFLGCAFMSFGEQLYLKEGVSYNRLREETIFLMEILSLQYIHPYNFVLKPEQFDLVIKELIKTSIILRQPQQKYLISKQQNNVFLFYCSLLRPAIECYWSTIVYFLTIVNKEQTFIELASFAEFHDQLQWFIESLYEEKVLDNYQSCSLEVIKNCLKKYQQLKIIQLLQVSKKEVRISILYSAEKLNQLEGHLKNFLKNIYRSAITSPVEQAKTTGISVDFLSKL